MAAKVVNGARCKVAISDPTTGQTKVVGIWNSFSYNVNYDTNPVFILGRYPAAELNTTGVEPVSITAGGWRVVDHDAFNEGRLTNVKDLLFQEYLTLTVVDRLTGKNIAVIKGCLPTGTSSTMSARQLTDSNNTYIGLLVDTETTVNEPDATSADLP